MIDRRKSLAFVSKEDVEVGWQLSRGLKDPPLVICRRPFWSLLYKDENHHVGEQSSLLVGGFPQLYVHLGSIHHRPYNWEGELRLEEEVRRSMTAWERFREACNFSGKEKPDVEVLLPSFLR